MAATNPISGPVPINEFREMVNLPAGEARKCIRKYDPLFGREPGEKIKWEVRFTGQGVGYAVVEAASKKDAEKLADKISDADIEWDDMEVDDFEVSPMLVK
jgi:hypothetical protein